MLAHLLLLLGLEPLRRARRDVGGPRGVHQVRHRRRHRRRKALRPAIHAHREAAADPPDHPRGPDIPRASRGHELDHGLRPLPLLDPDPAVRRRLLHLRGPAGGVDDRGRRVPRIGRGHREHGLPAAVLLLALDHAHDGVPDDHWGHPLGAGQHLAAGRDPLDPDPVRPLHQLRGLRHHEHHHRHLRGPGHEVRERRRAERLPGGAREASLGDQAAPQALQRGCQGGRRQQRPHHPQRAGDARP
mmetsp:Transcript_47937/g.126578  ORF Transcript_47937/g.126578 Transcript_47937/m.126578 type:complete len:244 (+) Transcript_47937:859-1590(+)